MKTVMIGSSKYSALISDGGVITSDGTRYNVDGTTGQWRKVLKKGATQREKRRLYGKMRRADGLTRSQAQKRDMELARIGM